MLAGAPWLACARLVIVAVVCVCVCGWVGGWVGGQFGAYEEMKLLGERDGRKLVRTGPSAAAFCALVTRCCGYDAQNALWYGAMGVVSKMLASTVTYPYQARRLVWRGVG